MAVLWPLATLALLVLRSWRGEYREPRQVSWLGLGYVALLVAFVVGLWPYLWEAPWQNSVADFQNMMHFRWGGHRVASGQFRSGN